jgi:sugar lactone lactonase YvrE
MAGAARARRWVPWFLAFLFAAGVVTGAIWWRLTSYPQFRPLTAGWLATVTVLAGDGIPGVRDDSAFGARFSDPFGVAWGADGSVYVSDAGDAQRIRRIAPDGAVSTFAGDARGYADGPARAARFSTPSGLAAGPGGVLYVADTGNNAVRRIAPDGMVSTLAGSIAAGYRDGPPGRALFNAPTGVAVDPAGRVIVADTYNDRIRAIRPDGSVITIAGSTGPGLVDGAAGDAQFDTPCGVATDRAGNIYVADSGNGAVRVVSPAGVVSSVGPLPTEGLFHPIGIGVTGNGIIYVTDDRGRIVEITPGVSARVLAGSRSGFADGPGTDARFRSLAGLALGGPGTIVVADSRNGLVRILTAASAPDIRPPAAPGIHPQFDSEAFAREPLLWPIAPMEGPFELTGTLGEPRGGEGGERFHAGIDVHAAEGSVVRAVRPGTVASPLAASEFGSLSESVRVGSLAYVHIRVGRDRHNGILDEQRFVPNYDASGRLVRIRVKRGATFATGEPIGTANAFNHVHLNVGWPGEEYNPLLFRVVQFEDSIPPTILRGGIRLFREDGQPIKDRKRGRLLVQGPVRVVVDAYDQANGNEKRRRLGLYALGYQVLHPDGSPVPGFDHPRQTMRFDRLAPGADAARIVYASGSGIPFYGVRSTRLLYVVTNSLNEGVASMGVWDTTQLPPGDYTLRIFAADTQGNVALANRDLALTVTAPGT